MSTRRGNPWKVTSKGTPKRNSVTEYARTACGNSILNSTKSGRISTALELQNPLFCPKKGVSGKVDRCRPNLGSQLSAKLFEELAPSACARQFVNATASGARNFHADL